MPKVMRIIGGVNVLEEVRSIDFTYGASIVDVRIERFDGRVELYSMPPMNFRVDQVNGEKVISLERAIVISLERAINDPRTYVDSNTIYKQAARGVILDKPKEKEVEKVKNEVKGEVGNMIDDIEF